MPNEKQTIKEIIEKGLKKAKVKDDTWYLIESKWFNLMKIYLDHKYSSEVEDSFIPHPGKIDYDPLFKIKTELRWKIDYVLVPEEVWTALVQEFGMAEGQMPISRKVIEEGGIVKYCTVEVNLFTLRLIDSSKFDIVEKKFSRADSLLTIQQTMKEVFQIPDDIPTRLKIGYLRAYGHLETEVMSNVELYKDLELQDLWFQQSYISCITIEKQNSDGTWHTRYK